MRHNNCCPKCRRIPGVCGARWVCTCHRDKGAWTDPSIDGTAKGYDNRVNESRARLEERKS